MGGRLGGREGGEGRRGGGGREGGGLSKKALNVQDDSRSKGIQGNTSKSEIKCVCLNARSIINKKTELNIMVDDIKPHIIGITESWANKDITNCKVQAFINQTNMYRSNK